ncbi:hypothetical protein [Variovorax sp. Root411]|uniref:hypothetical protein n=1 Tax=Variovorax sp. Root411 TaxID=1736530 RepID=UPI0012F70FFB|nr:hypothetical protein [Variovorax sp. Root411]
MSFFIEGSWKEWFLVEGDCGNRQQLGGAMRLSWIRRGRATGFTRRHRVGFAPQPHVRRLRVACGLAKIRPSFFSDSFFPPRLATTNLPGDKPIQ